MMILYQLRPSHYCEKIRWALDYKGLPYQTKDLLPGFHAKTALKLAPKTTLPILVDAETVVQDSTAIISYLEKKAPPPSLTPAEPVFAKQALDWEDYLDEEIGAPLRLIFYHAALPDRVRTLTFLLEGAPWYAWPLYTLIYPQLRKTMTKAMRINADTAKVAEARLLAALDRLDQALQGRSFLVGEVFSRADLTACALLRNLCLPSVNGNDSNAPLAAFRDSQKSRPFFKWVRETTAVYRHKPFARA